MNVAVLTYGRLKAPVGHSSVAEFVDAADAISALAERCEGVLWRCASDQNEDTMAHYQKHAGDPRVSMTLSVWSNRKAVRRHAFSTLRGRFWKKRSDWFAPQDGANMVMWYVPEDHHPDYAEALKKLANFNTNGSSDYASRWDDEQVGTPDRCN